MEPIASDMIALAKKLTSASFKPLSDGIGLVSFKQTTVPFSWEPTPTVSSPLSEKDKTAQVAEKLILENKNPENKNLDNKKSAFSAEEKDIAKQEKLLKLENKTPASSTLGLRLTRFFFAHVIDLVFILSLLSCAFLATDFFLMPQEQLTFFEQIKKIILAFPKEWGGFLISFDGLLVTYFLFFVYIIFFKFTAGGSIGSFLSKK